MADVTQTARMRNFEVLASQPVVITARGGRVFALRDDIPTSTLLRYRVLPDIAERVQEMQVRLLTRFEAEAREAEAKRAEAGEDTAAEKTPDETSAETPDETSAETPVPVSAQLQRQREQAEFELRMTAATRAEMAAVRHGYEVDICALCGDIFRWTLPELTDVELFGAWDEAIWSWRGGVFSPDEAEQLIELFMGLRGLGSSPLPNAQGATPSGTESSTGATKASDNRASRRAEKRRAPAKV